MSIRCGQCKDHHETVADVRECYASARRPAQEATTGRGAAGPLWGWNNRQGAPTATLARAYPVREPAPTEPGFYRSGVKVYRLAEDGTWALLMANGRFSGGARAPYRPERMTVDEVAAQGKIHIRCIVCGISLRNPESRAAGIGPVCRTKV